MPAAPIGRAESQSPKKGAAASRGLFFERRGEDVAARRSAQYDLVFR